MEAEIKNGKLVLMPDSETEKYALRAWIAETQTSKLIKVDVSHLYVEYDDSDD